MGAGLVVTVRSTVPKLQADLRQFVRAQVPFATAKALTRTAQDARDAQREGMKRRFTIRNRRVLRGITIERAEKRAWPRIQAKVGTLDPFIARFEEGGRQTPKRTSPGVGGPRFAIPTRAVVSRRTATGRIPASLKPRNLLSSNRALIPDDGQGDSIILKRRRKRTMGGLKRIFTLKRAIRLKKRLRLFQTVHRTTGRVYLRHFQRELRGAVASRRR